MPRKKHISVLIALLLLIGFGVYVGFHQDEFAPLLSVSVNHLGVLLVLTLFATGVLGLSTKYLVAVFGINLKFKEWFGLTVITTMSNYFVPLRGGSSVKAVYLKKKYGLSYAKFLSTIMGIFILTFWVASAVGSGLSIIFYYLQYTFALKIFLFFLVTNGAMSLLLFISPAIADKKNRLLRILKRVLDGWIKIKSNKRLLTKLAFLSLAGYILKALQLFFAYRSLSLEVDFLAVFLLSVLLVFSIFINITPANLGIQEGLLSLFSSLLGIGFNEGLLAALLFRTITMAVAFCLGPIFSYLLINKQKEGR